MTDTLRTRIAAAIMDSCHGVFVDDAVHAADAVIRELGLEAENKSYFDGMSPGYTMTRYVTEWSNDD